MAGKAKTRPANGRLYAVITGDVVASRRFRQAREELLEALRGSFAGVDGAFPDVVVGSFQIFRGDSFQGVLSEPRVALSAAVLIRSALRCARGLGPARTPDARIVVGIGSISFIPRDGAVSEGDGQAFDLSGPVLDESKKGGQLLTIRTPCEQANAELAVECALLDALIVRWSPQQAEVIAMQAKGWTQARIASTLGVTVQAVGQRLRRAGGPAFRSMIERYEHLISKLATADERRGRHRQEPTR